MVESSLDAVFRALADPTRRAMLASLAREARTVGELAEPFEMSLAAASKHIQTLERAGLVRRTVHGRTHICRLDARPLRDGMDWIRRYERFWAERLDALEAQLRSADSSAPLSRTEPTSAPSPRPRPASRGPRIAAPRERPAHPTSRRKGS